MKNIRRDDEDEEPGERYGFFSNYNAPKPKSDFDFAQPVQKKPAVQQQQQQQQQSYMTASGGVAGIVVHDVIPHEVIDLKRFEKAGVPPVAFKARAIDRPRIPYDIHHAMTVLYDACETKRISMPRTYLADVTKVLRCDHEYVTIDPPIVLEDVISTGVCIIALREVVPVSVMLLALYLVSTFSIEVVPGMPSSKPKPFREIVTKPFFGEESAIRAQPFGILQIVQASLVERDYDVKMSAVRMEALMAQIGPISTEEAADPQWLSDTASVIKATLDAEVPIARTSQSIGYENNTAQAEQSVKESTFQKQ